MARESAEDLEAGKCAAAPRMAPKEGSPLPHCSFAGPMAESLQQDKCLKQASLGHIEKDRWFLWSIYL